jgi:hypothetical protein
MADLRHSPSRFLDSLFLEINAIALHNLDVRKENMTKMSKDKISSKELKTSDHNITQDMIKRVFAVAELVAKSKSDLKTTGQQNSQLLVMSHNDEPVVS